MKEILLAVVMTIGLNAGLKQECLKLTNTIEGYNVYREVPKVYEENIIFKATNKYQHYDSNDNYQTVDLYDALYRRTQISKMIDAKRSNMFYNYSSSTVNHVGFSHQKLRHLTVSKVNVVFNQMETLFKLQEQFKKCEGKTVDKFTFRTKGTIYKEENIKKVRSLRKLLLEKLAITKTQYEIDLEHFKRGI